ncbi:hypothetical protein [Streptomyces vinaceus]|uniref:hypothetical protein n=1 Tax=Streptomyces vinaceus TaxID=1960 RepID=UPI0038148BC3
MSDVDKAKAEQALRQAQGEHAKEAERLKEAAAKSARESVDDMRDNVRGRDDVDDDQRR